MKFAAYQAQHVGQRASQQDSCLVWRGRLPCFVVADGVGGSAGGEVASSLACETIRDVFATAPADATAKATLQRAVREANDRIHTLAATVRRLQDMGTTIVAAALEADEARGTVIHAGDSRAYHLHAGRLTRLTRDHSALEEARALRPRLSARKLAKIPRNIITCALGDELEEDTELGTSIDFEVEPGDTLLLCSDGLWGGVTSATLRRTVRKPCADIAEALVTASGGPKAGDNTTALVVRIF